MKMICINCPRGCELEVVQQNGEIVVTGNACPRGETYGKAELVCPTRMVTGLVRIAGMRKPMPVKTRVAIPKTKINEVLFAMHQTTSQLPIHIGDVIINNVAETGVDIIATANME